MTRQEKEQAILAYCEEVTKESDYNNLGLMVSVRKCRIDSTLDGFKITVGRGEELFAYKGMPEKYLHLLYLLLGLETRALEEEVKRLRDGIRKVASLTNYPEIALQYLDPPTP